MISGRTQSIISRFPRFYSPDDPQSWFFQLLEVFGDSLNEAETDLMQVLRSHFVGTAENIDSQGLTGKHKGDLDRIFAFYLEQLGGTSQLSQVNPKLQVGEFKHLDELIKILLGASYQQQPDSPFTAYLWQSLSNSTQTLLQRYAVENARGFDDLCSPKKEEVTANWLLGLLSGKDSLSQELKKSFSPQIQQLLQKYDGSVPVPLEIKKAIALHLNKAILPNPIFSQQVLRHYQELSAQISCLQSLINPSKEQEITTIQRRVGNFLLPRLSPGLQIALADNKTESDSGKQVVIIALCLIHIGLHRLASLLLEYYPESQLNSLYLRFTSELRPQLQSPRLATQISQQLKQLKTPSLTLSEDAYVILWQAVRTALAEVLALVQDGQQWVMWVDLLRRYERLEQRSLIKDIPNLETLQLLFLPFLQPLLQRPDLCRFLDSLGQETDHIATDSILPEETFSAVWETVSAALTQESLIRAFADLTQTTQRELILRFGKEPPEENRAIINPIRIMLAQFLVGGISSTLPPASSQPEKSQDLPTQLREKLNKLFADPTNCQQLLALFEQVEAQALPPYQQQISHLLGALIAASQTILREQLNSSLQQKLNQLQLAPDLQTLINQKPSGEHLERLNRRLLEAVFPEIGCSQIPAASEIAQALAEDFNEKVLKDVQLYDNYKDFFSQLLLTLTTQSFIRDYQPDPAKFSPEKLVFLNRLLLESAYPRQIEHCDTPYRERLKRLIGVLKNGASPSDGILEIVAANLGMNTDPNQLIKPWEEYLFDLPSDIETHLNSLTASIDLQKVFNQRNVTLSVETTILMEEWMQVWVLSDGPRGQVYRLRRHNAGFSVHRQMIRVIEYQAGSQKQQFTVHPNPSDGEKRATFDLNNPSASIETPTLELTLIDSRLGSKERKLPPLKVIRLKNQTTQEFIEYRGGFDVGEQLRFSADGSVLEQGIQVPKSTVSGRLPSLASGNSTWCIEAEIDLEQTKLDQCNLDFARFESEPEQQPMKTPQMDCYDIKISIIRQQLVYGSFTVQIPWDIPGYTDRFNNTVDHPRHQIHSLINKVRAAGISFSIIYDKFVALENHEIEDKLEIKQIQTPIKQKKLYDDRPSNVIEHEMSDNLILAQMFDYTYFDSLNMFA